MKQDQPLHRITALLDGELDNDASAALESEIASDVRLKREYDLESSVRSVIRERRSQIRSMIPAELERSIRMQLAAEVSTSAQQAPSISGWWSTIISAFRRPLVAIPTGLAAIAMIVLMTSGRNESPSVLAMQGGFDLYQASYANFSKVVKGELQLVKATTNQEELRSFFASEGVDYEVFFPEIAAELKGGVVSEHNGVHYAHIVYGVGDHLVYIFEVDEASIEKNAIFMKSEIAQDLKQSRWHWEERKGLGTMFVWESNNVICSAVSDLRTQDFSALFTLEKL